MSFKLSRITSKFSRGHWDIHLFGYEDGKFVKRMEKYYDYFYYSAEHISDCADNNAFDTKKADLYDSLYGEKVQKVYYTSIKERNKLSKTHPTRIYQADVKPEFKYILDNNIEWSDDRHIVYYDIETWYDPNDSSQNSPAVANMPITSLVGYSTMNKKYFVFSWHPEHTKDLEEPKVVNETRDGDNITIVYTKTEEEMIQLFLRFVVSSNADILSGWYSDGFDMPYILNRCKRLGIDSDILSPINDIWFTRKGEFWRHQIRGLDSIDMMAGLQDMGYNLPNWKLDTAAKVILDNPDVEKLTTFTWKDWLDNYQGFIDYGIMDVKILKEINEKIQMFDLFITVQKTANLEGLGMVFFKSMIVDNYIIKSNHNEIIMPIRIKREKTKYAGALVIDPVQPGNSHDVTVMDYTSLYPTTMMAFNISPETFIASKESCEKIGVDIQEVADQLIKDGVGFVDTGDNPELFGGRYLFYSHSEKVGVLPRILKDLFLRRVEINRKLKAGEYPEYEINAMEKRQWAFKIILNSAYGAMGFNFFRLYKPECADAITFFARQALKFASVKFHNEGHKLIYGDTDSIFVLAGKSSADEMIEKLVHFNKDLDTDFVRNYNPGVLDEYQHMDLKFEYDLEYCYFGESKKRYYGIIRGSGKKVIRGLNIIRKDTPNFLKGELNDMAEQAVRGQLQIDWLVDLRDKLASVEPKELGIAKAFGKPFEKYVKTMPQHVKAAKWANAKLGTEITNKDNPYLFYIKSNCEDDLKKKDKQRAICLNEEDLGFIETKKDIFEIDYDVYFDKQVVQQLEGFDLIPEVAAILENYKEVKELAQGSVA